MEEKSLKLFMFRFSNIPYGSTFVATIAADRETAIEQALVAIGPLSKRDESKYREEGLEQGWGIRDGQDIVRPGAVVSGWFEE